MNLLTYNVEYQVLQAHYFSTKYLYQEKCFQLNDFHLTTYKVLLQSYIKLQIYFTYSRHFINIK